MKLRGDGSRLYARCTSVLMYRRTSSADFSQFQARAASSLPR